MAENINDTKQHQQNANIPLYGRTTSIKKTIGITAAICFFIGLFAGFIVVGGKNTDEQTIRESVEASFEQERQKMQEQQNLYQKMKDVVSAYQLVLSKEEAIQQLDAKIQKVMDNTRRAQQNVGNDASIKALNPALYNNLLETIEKDGQRQYNALKKAQDTLMGIPSTQQTSPRQQQTQSQPSHNPKPLYEGIRIPETNTTQEEVIIDDKEDYNIPNNSGYNAPNVIEDDVLSDAFEENNHIHEHHTHTHTQTEDAAPTNTEQPAQAEIPQSTQENLQQPTQEQQEEFTLPF